LGTENGRVARSRRRVEAGRGKISTFLVGNHKKRLGPVRAKKSRLGPVFLAFSAFAGVSLKHPHTLYLSGSPVGRGEK